MNLFFRRKTANLLKSTLRCGYFSRFFNCINSTKKRKASQIMNIKKSSSRCGGITRENTKNNNKGKILTYQLCLHNTSTKLILLFTHSYWANYEESPLQECILLLFSVCLLNYNWLMGHGHFGENFTGAREEMNKKWLIGLQKIEFTWDQLLFNAHVLNKKFTTE